jgi:sterol desaturase/sphingolipid hydroxylase (fatty acid hydroxylase superfamily)
MFDSQALLDELVTASFALAWLIAIFVPLEWARPMWSGQRRLRPGLATDLGFFAGQQLLFGSLVAWTLVRVIELVPIDELLAPVHASVASWPLALRAIVVIVLGDLAMYWGHRWQHRNPWLWRFHAVHHTPEQLDFVAAYREHPLDTVYTQWWMNLPAVLLGVSFEGLLGLVMFRGLWATFIHANVNVPLGPLAYVLGSPRLHHLHHLRQRDIGNYANLAPWIDVLFGTHHDGELSPELGIEEPAPRGYFGLLWWPFRRR